MDNLWNGQPITHEYLRARLVHHTSEQRIRLRCRKRCLHEASLDEHPVLLSDLWRSSARKHLEMACLHARAKRAAIRLLAQLDAAR